MDADPLIDRIYEAGILPDFWPNVLSTLSERYQGAGTVLFAVGTDYSRWTSSVGFEETVSDFVDGGWAARNTRPARAIARRLTGFVTDAELFANDEIEGDPIYVEFMKPRGLGGELGTLIRVPTGDNMILSVVRSLERGAASEAMIASANLLQPHLARAALFSARLGLERARAAADALKAVGLASAVLNGSGRMIALNDLFDQLLPDVVQDRTLRVALTDKAADGLLQEALIRLATQVHPGVSSIPLKAVGPHPPAIVHLLPIRRAARDIFTSAASLLLVTPVNKRATVSAGLLEGLFDLTPAEARVARVLADGDRTVVSVAALLGVSPETVRSQLSSLFAKTGTTRRADFVGLLATAGAFGKV